MEHEANLKFCFNNTNISFEGKICPVMMVESKKLEASWYQYQL